MLGFIFKGATYYIIWQKIQKRFVMVLVSLVLIFAIIAIYNDLFQVFKVSYKESLMGLLFLKWFLIASIIGFNSYKLLKEPVETKLDEAPIKPYPKKSQEVLDKEGELNSISDVILKKYLHAENSFSYPMSLSF